MYDVLVDDRPLAEVRRQVGENLWIAAADINLAAAEVELAGVVGREVDPARSARIQDRREFDFVLMDCGPSLGVLRSTRWPRPPRSLFPCSRTSWPCMAWANCWRRPPWSPSASTRICR